MPKTTAKPLLLFGLAVDRGERYSLAQYPLFYAGMFDAFRAEIGGIPSMMLDIKGDVKLAPLLKAVDRIQRDTALPCIVASPFLTAYQKRRLSEERIAWLASEDVFHIPFLGMAASRTPRVCERRALSAPAFRLLAGYLAGEFDSMTTQQVARAIGKSLASTHNYFAELNSLFPGLVGSRGRARFLEPSMRHAIAKSIFRGGDLSFLPPAPEKRYLKTSIETSVLLQTGFKRSGLTALAGATMIADDPWPTLAIGKRALRSTPLMAESLEVTPYDEPDLLVEVWPYEFDDREGDSLLPLEVFLSLKDEAEADERVAAALETMEAHQ